MALGTTSQRDPTGIDPKTRSAPSVHVAFAAEYDGLPLRSHSTA
jgi:hypothetical protein